jgi:hypothetical protein
MICPKADVLTSRTNANAAMRRIIGELLVKVRLNSITSDKSEMMKIRRKGAEKGKLRQELLIRKN